MSAVEPQIVEPLDFTSLDEYQFSGNAVTVENKRQLVVAFRERGTIAHAAERVGVSRKCVHHYINTDEVFALAMASAHEDSGDKLESSVYERAFKSDLLAMFWLKAYRPKFRDKMSIDVEDLREQVRERIASTQMQSTQSQQLPVPSAPEQKDSD